MSQRLTRHSARLTKADKPTPAGSDPLETGRREEFCRLQVEGLGVLASYRKAYQVPLDLPAAKVHSRAVYLNGQPGIQHRIQFLKDELARLTLYSVSQLLQEYIDIATADPNELVSSKTDCCRYCWGTDFKYCYASQAIYDAALIKALEADQLVPECGGVDYHPDKEPNPCCPLCFGRGLEVVLIRDTTKLSAKARKLYKGAKQTKSGYEILMHDQDNARQQIGRILGAFKAEGSWTPPPPAPDPTKAAEPKDATSAYLALVKG